MNARVLIVDDNTGEAESLRSLIEADGFPAAVAASLEQAKEIIPAQGVELVLACCRVGDENGLELVPWAKQLLADKAPAVIAITSQAGGGERLPALDAGAVDILLKPLDIPELRAKVRLHLEIRALNNKLSIHNEELSSVNARLRHTLELKNQFLARLTHDLRTPITTIKLAIDVLGAKAVMPQPDPSRQPIDLFRIIVRNINRVETVFDEIVSVARLDVADLQLSPAVIDLNMVAKETLSNSFSEAIQRSISLDADFQQVQPIQADLRRIRQLIANLVAVSLSRIDCDARAVLETREENGGVLVAIRDNGPIMSAKAIDNLLKGLEAEAPIRETRIEYYVIHRIALAHGGRFWIENVGGTETRFCAWLPLRPQPGRK